MSDVGVGWMEAFLWGAIGGLLVELIGLRDLHRQAKRKKLPAFIRSKTYLILAALAILGSGVLPLLYVRSGTSLPALLAFNVGASAPVFVRTAATSVPPLSPGKTD